MSHGGIFAVAAVVAAPILKLCGELSSALVSGSLFCSVNSGFLGSAGSRCRKYSRKAVTAHTGE